MTTPAVESEKTSGPRSAKGERTRARIIDAAKAVFEDVGFLDARITDIAEKAGLAHGSFYTYFDSKDDVFLEVAEALDARLTGSSILAADVPPGMVDPKISDVVRAGIGRFLGEYRDEARIMGVIEQVSRYHEPVREIRNQRFAAYLHEAEQAIGNLQRDGWSDSHLDPAIVSSALIAMITRFAELWLAQGALEADFDHAVDQLTRLCVNALQLHDA
jgi:AcrR family transcriptional regulator